MGSELDNNVSMYLTKAQNEKKNRASIAQSGAAPFTSKIVGLILWLPAHVKRVRQHFAEGRGFSPGIPVSSHKEC